MAGFGRQIAYKLEKDADGRVEVNADKLARLSIRCLDALHEQMAAAGLRAAGVSFCAFWHSFLGVDAESKPTTNILHLLDTRSAPYIAKLRASPNAAAFHARTGCVFHTSYWPARLCWLKAERPSEWGRTAQWVSFGEYLYQLLFGSMRSSTSMVSASGLWDSNRGDYDGETLALTEVRAERLRPLNELDEPQDKLRPRFAKKWPLFDGIPWYPAIGDGAANNIGTGCITPDRFALMVGTTGAMRAAAEVDHVDVPPGLWRYRADSRRFVLGGALSNGGEVFSWVTQRLKQIPRGEALEQALAAAEPGSHDLTILPLFAGERSTGWRAEARATFDGMSLATTPMDILRASLEAVALRFRQIYDILELRVGRPTEVVATGAALSRSPAWVQMMADALGRPVVSCLEEETSSRGAAMLAMERLRLVKHVRELPTRLGATVEPVTANAGVYSEMLARQKRLYEKLYGE